MAINQKLNINGNSNGENSRDVVGFVPNSAYEPHPSVLAGGNLNRVTARLC